jgi:uncharacterized protein YndB with AHSA1/START domain
MPETIAPVQYKAEVKRTLNASCERVYKAWTTTSALQQWFRPNERMKCIVPEADIRVGGKYRIEFHHNDGDIFALSGIYTQLQPFHEISFTLNWDESSFQKTESIVTVSLKEHQGKTEMTLLHTKLSSELSATEHTKGWTGCVDSLENYINGDAD